MARVISKQEKKRNDALVGINTVIGGFVYRILVPKGLQRAYEAAREREDSGKKLSAMDNTVLYGYLNPRYHSAVEPRKRTH